MPHFFVKRRYLGFDKFAKYVPIQGTCANKGALTVLKIKENMSETTDYSDYSKTTTD